MFNTAFTHTVYDGEETFTQEQVGKLIANAKREASVAHSVAISELEKSLKELQSKYTDANARAAETDRLFNELKGKQDTDSVLKVTALEKAKKELEEQLATANGNAQAWQSRHSQALITTSIVQAAAAEGAVNPKQIQALLERSAQVKAETDDEGKITGFNVTVPWTLQQGDKTVNVELPVDQAIKAMKEDTSNYGNLFKATLAGGINGNNHGGREMTLAEAAKAGGAVYVEYAKTHLDRKK